jgi:Arc/MetJ family transcription regulator
MRTTFDLPEQLLEDAQKAARLATKRETVIAGLQELVQKAKREDLRRLAGRVDLCLDAVKSRKPHS